MEESMRSELPESQEKFLKNLSLVGPQLTHVTTQRFLQLPGNILTTLLPNIQYFHAEACSFDQDEFLLNDSIRSLDLSRTNIRTIIPPDSCNSSYLHHPSRSCWSVSLRSMINDIFSSALMNWLGHATKVILNDNKFLTDVSALISVPYLSLNKCPNVTNFSVLGKKQKYLSIGNNQQLVDEDLVSFSDVPDLDISLCSSIRA